MKKRILDTDTFSLWFQGNPSIGREVEAYLLNFDFLTISRINEYEILRGLEYRRATAKLARFYTLLESIEVLDFTQQACQIAARLYGELRRTGQPLEDADIQIAAIALANDCVLVTNNERHFNRISSLSIENWKTTPPS